MSNATRCAYTLTNLIEIDKSDLAVLAVLHGLYLKYFGDWVRRYACAAMIQTSEISHVETAELLEAHSSDILTRS